MDKVRANKVKKVNIKSRIPIRNVTPPISGCHSGIMMDTSNILKCINKRAIVDEILSDGSLVRLNLSNYYKDNEPVKTEPSVTYAHTISNEVVEKKEEVEETPAIVEEPIVETTAETQAVDEEHTVVSEEDTAVATSDLVDETTAEDAEDEEVSATAETAELESNDNSSNSYNENRKKKRH